jgi:hypothetical protein
MAKDAAITYISPAGTFIPAKKTSQILFNKGNKKFPVMLETVKSLFTVYPMLT